MIATYPFPPLPCSPAPHTPHTPLSHDRQKDPAELSGFLFPFNKNNLT